MKNSYESSVAEVTARIAEQDESFFKGSLPKAELLDSAQAVLKNIGGDIERIRKEGGVLFSSEQADKNAGHDIARAFEKWRSDPPGTVALLCVAAEVMGIPPEDKNFKAALLAGIAAEVKNENAYHNNSHFREVTAMMARFCHANNELAARGDPKAVLLEDRDIAKCLLAAASHDLGHDGKNNASGGAHRQYLLEDKAIGTIEPLMALAGMTKDDREDVRVMIRVTDVSAPKEGTSPHKLLRAAFAENFENGKPVSLPPELARLKNNPALLTQAALMSDADLAPSAGTNLAFGLKQTELLSKEDPAVTRSDKSFNSFMTFIVEDRFLSPAAQAAAGKSLQETNMKTAARLAHGAGLDSLSARVKAKTNPHAP